MQRSIQPYSPHRQLGAFSTFATEEMEPWRLFLLAVTPLEVQKSAEAAKGNGKEHRRKLRGQFCKQNSNGGGQRSKGSNTTTVIWWHKDTGWTPENMERREQGIHREEEGQRRNKEIETPANCLDEVLPLPGHWTHCLQPSPFLPLSWASLSTDSACSKSEGDWCGTCTRGRSVPGIRSTSLFSLVHSARFALQVFKWLKCKSTASYPAWQPVLENVHVWALVWFYWDNPIQNASPHLEMWGRFTQVPWLGTASSPFLCILTMGPIIDAGCCKNRNLVLQGNPLIFLSDYNGRYSEANSTFFSAEIQAWRCQKWWQELSISMRWQPTCSTLSTSHTQTISSYCKHQWDSATKLNLAEKGSKQNVLAVP